MSKPKQSRHFLINNYGYMFFLKVDGLHSPYHCDYYTYDKFTHRDGDLPAVIDVRLFYEKKSTLHRAKGPAIVDPRPGGINYYYSCGVMTGQTKNEQ